MIPLQSVTQVQLLQHPARLYLHMYNCVGLVPCSKHNVDVIMILFEDHICNSTLRCIGSGGTCSLSGFDQNHAWCWISMPWMSQDSDCRFVHVCITWDITGRVWLLTSANKSP